MKGVGHCASLPTNILRYCITTYAHIDSNCQAQPSPKSAGLSSYIFTKLPTLHNLFWIQIYFLAQILFQTQNFYGPKKNFGSKIYLRPKKFCGTNIFSDLKYLSYKIFFVGPKFFLTTILLTKILLGPKCLLDSTFFQAEFFLYPKFFLTKIFLTKNISDAKFFLDPKIWFLGKFLSNHNFFGPKKIFRPKIFIGPKILLDQNRFGHTIFLDI